MTYDIYSKTGADAAIAAAAGGTSAGFATQFMRNLQTEHADQNLFVMGDSVSVGSGSWFAKLVSKLAARFPAYTVTIQHYRSADNSGYEAPITVQTGTGSKTLNAYVIAKSGVPTGYYGDFNNSFPVHPDLLLIATGHNDSLQVDLERSYRNTIVFLYSRFPRAAIGFVSVNPEAPADTYYQTMFESINILSRIGGQAGVGFIDAMQPWLVRPGGYADLMADTVHPNNAGHEFLAQTVYGQLAATLTGPAVALPRIEQQLELFIPMQGSFVIAGTPELAVRGVYGSTVGMAFDKETDETVVTAPVLVPYTWQKFLVDLLYTSQSASGVAVFRTEPLWISTAAPGGAAYAPDISLAVPAPGKATWGTTLGNDWSPYTPIAASYNSDSTAIKGSFSPLQFRVTRVGTAAADTCDGDVLVYGIRLRRWY